MCFHIPLVDPGNFMICSLFIPPWPPQNAPKPFLMLSLDIFIQLRSSVFNKFLSYFGLIIYKSGYATETFMKGVGGAEGAGVCISKAFFYFLLPLEFRSSDKVHETERTRNSIICLCYQIYICCVCVYMHNRAVNERPRSGPSFAIDCYNIWCFHQHTAGYLNVMFSTKGLIVAAECWGKTWETNYTLYCMSTSQTFIVIFMKARIFKFVLITVCCNVIRIILSC
jgi:hypothetical protein